MSNFNGPRTQAETIKPKLEKFKNYELKVNIPDAEALRVKASETPGHSLRKLGKTDNVTEIQTPGSGILANLDCLGCHKIENRPDEK